MFEWIEANAMLVFWVVLAVVCGVVEAATVAVVSIWFVIGAGFAAILALLGAPVLAQVLVAITVSGLTLGLVRKSIIKTSKKKIAKDEIQAISEGKIATVTQEIRPGKWGQICLNGDYWSARALNDNDVIPVDACVIVYKIDGACCIVALDEA
ncbi:MAG: NfeD family protein [Proteobacteria bacterium]|nr:NfeD family protein [Pseudomonadota bacterium]